MVAAPEEPPEPQRPYRGRASQGFAPGGPSMTEVRERRPESLPPSRIFHERVIEGDRA